MACLVQSVISIGFTTPALVIGFMLIRRGPFGEIAAISSTNLPFSSNNSSGRYDFNQSTKLSMCSIASPDTGIGTW